MQQLTNNIAGFLRNIYSNVKELIRIGIQGIVPFIKKLVRIGIQVIVLLLFMQLCFPYYIGTKVYTAFSYFSDIFLSAGIMVLIMILFNRLCRTMKSLEVSFSTSLSEGIIVSIVLFILYLGGSGNIEGFAGICSAIVLFIVHVFVKMGLVLSNSIHSTERRQKIIPQAAPFERLVNPNARRQIIATVIVYLIYIAVSIFHVLIYIISEGENDLEGIFSYSMLLPLVYHIGFLVINRKKRLWFFEQVLTSYVMTVIAFIVLNILGAIYPNYSGWEHLLDGIELLFLMSCCAIRMAYIPIITYIAWRIRNKGQSTSLRNHYPRKLLLLTTLIALLFLIIVVSDVGHLVFGDIYRDYIFFIKPKFAY